jgi:hypothetical protein
MASAAAAAARPEGGREERSEHWQFKPAGQAPQAAALPHLPLASCTTQCLPARQQCPAAHSLSAPCRTCDLPPRRLSRQLGPKQGLQSDAQGEAVEVGVDVAHRAAAPAGAQHARRGSQHGLQLR